MIQFNLLPEVKIKYEKAKRTKRLITTVAMITITACVTLVVMLFFYVQIAQKNHISDLTNDIDAEIRAIESVEDLDKILTIKGQLDDLNLLHDAKPETSRIFGYLNQLTPEKVRISSVDIDFVATTWTISGSADNLAVINQFADTLKFAKYKASPLTGSLETEQGSESASEDESIQPFTDVITDLQRDDIAASYSVTFSFDPTLFDITQKVVLEIPTQITTRSVLNSPNPLFEEIPTESTGGAE